MALVCFAGGPWHGQVRDVEPLPEKAVIRPDPEAGSCYVVYRSRLQPTEGVEREAVWVDAPQGWLT